MALACNRSIGTEDHIKGDKNIINQLKKLGPLDF